MSEQSLWEDDLCDGCGHMRLWHKWKSKVSGPYTSCLLPSREGLSGCMCQGFREPTNATPQDRF